jgi:hypothetical protein
MQHDPAMPTELPFQIVKFFRSPLKPILRRPRERAGLAVLRRWTETAAAPGVLGVA